MSKTMTKIYQGPKKGVIPSVYDHIFDKNNNYQLRGDYLQILQTHIIWLDKPFYAIVIDNQDKDKYDHYRRFIYKFDDLKSTDFIIYIDFTTYYQTYNDEEFFEEQRNILNSNTTNSNTTNSNTTNSNTTNSNTTNSNTDSKYDLYNNSELIEKIKKLRSKLENMSYRIYPTDIKNLKQWTRNELKQEINTLKDSIQNYKLIKSVKEEHIVKSNGVNKYNVEIQEKLTNLLSKNPVDNNIKIIQPLKEYIYQAYENGRNPNYKSMIIEITNTDNIKTTYSIVIKISQTFWYYD